MRTVCNRRIHSPATHGGFTLIELLTVIAIIGLLAGILIPVVGRVRKSARAAVCTSNLRQVHGGIMMYAQDNKDRFPAVLGTNELGSAWVEWWKLVAPYMGVKNTNRYPFPALQCPEVSLKIDTAGLGNGAKIDSDGLPWSAHPNYGMNLKLGTFMTDRAAGISEGSNISIGNVKNPSRTLLAGDNGRGYSACPAHLGPGNPPSNSDITKSPVIGDGDQHPGGSNMLWVDGHISHWKDVKRLVQSPYAVGSNQDVWSP
ncbi:type II secretion system protein [Opitutaceae bacterium TAV4]|nr:type II secretion system protein [Opitutaceae bacterium TAV4]RRK01169.1 type II secretion system protein [Opitutaceae bacterium TAV3]